MKQVVELKLLPKEAVDEQLILQRAAKKCRISPTEITDLQYLKRSIDARGSRPFIRLRTKISTDTAFSPEAAILSTFQAVSDAPKVLIIGAGPAGYFAALECIELGYKPILLDRGKPVRERRRDLRAIQQFGQVHPDSNYCFGEGGAGTYSDGKLYTRSHKRGKIEKVLRLLVEHGAKSDILIDAHPHIGSNKLPAIVANIRETILKYGGEIHFGKRVNDFIIHDQKIIGVIANQQESFYAKTVILATGHSARDIYKLLHRKQIYIEAKPFALGVRIEHPQALIDEIQYNQRPREEHLPASSYKLVSQVKGRGVFSFCMCPGGLIVPAATTPGELVVNGMSLSRRDSAFANSGTVVGVELEDLKAYQQHGVFAAMEFQKEVEQNIFQFGDGSQKAPAQRLEDFVAGKVSSTLPTTSYIPGIYAAPLHQLLPNSIYKKLRQGVLDFGKKMKGYYSKEAVVVGTESRTSSPIRIPRNRETYMHEQIEGLFPCGEGAGYAGGILSAAMDGQNVARAVAKWLNA
ncbi:MAG: FAD-dependent protein [Bacteroidota bacterium]